jgi:hypothetical protein
MITMWIVVGVLGAAALVWRLRKASARLDRILREEREASEPESLPASHDR